MLSAAWCSSMISLRRCAGTSLHLASRSATRFPMPEFGSASSSSALHVCGCRHVLQFEPSKYHSEPAFLSRLTSPTLHSYTCSYILLGRHWGPLQHSRTVWGAVTCLQTCLFAFALASANLTHFADRSRRTPAAHASTSSDARVRINGDDTPVRAPGHTMSLRPSPRGAPNRSTQRHR
jgi:hypothetical protein